MVVRKDPTEITPKEPEYDINKVDGRIVNYTKQIRQKMHLEDVTESMARVAELAGLIANESKDTAEYIKEFMDEVQTEWNSNPNKDPEIITARGGESNLNARLTKQHQEVTAQLAQTGQRVDNLILEYDIDPNKDPELIDARLGFDTLGEKLINFDEKTNNLAEGVEIPEINELSTGVKDEIIEDKLGELSVIKRVSDTYKIEEFLTSMLAVNYSSSQPHPDLVVGSINLREYSRFNHAYLDFISKGGSLKDRNVGDYKNKDTATVENLTNVGEMSAPGGSGRNILFTMAKSDFEGVYELNSEGVRQYCIDNALSITYQLPEEEIISLSDKSSSAIQTIRLMNEIEKLKQGTGSVSLDGYMIEENEEWIVNGG